ncbi:MAG: hypothetical protein ACLQJR_20665 [Stellaceae bacterium]
MLERQSFRRRWEDYQASKTVVFWACAGCIVATLILGFTWGGWVTGGTAERMASQGATAARADLAATICVSRFESGPDTVVNLASLKASDSWTRSDFIEKGGWATLAGTEKPVSGAANLCAQRLMDAKPPTQAPGVSG